MVSRLIPYSFYNINSSYNVLKYSFDGVTINTLRIPIGNYNVNNLETILKSNLLSGFSVLYNSIQNKLTFTNSTTEFMFMSSSTCLQILL